MKITFRLLASLLLAVTSVAALASLFQARQERARLVEEIQRRSRLLAETLEESVAPLSAGRDRRSLQRIVDRFSDRERLAGVAVYDAQGRLLAASESLAGAVDSLPGSAAPVLSEGRPAGSFVPLLGRRLYLHASPLEGEGRSAGILLVLHEAAHIDARLGALWRNNFLRALAQVVLVTVIVLLVVRSSIASPLAALAAWMRGLRDGETGPPPAMREPLFAPIAREAESLARHLNAARAAAEEEARLRHSAEAVWTPERLKEHVRSKLGGRSLFVVSNREPYMHVKDGRSIKAIMPAGGVVTALDAVLRACGGTWVAHGSGDADWSVVDDKDRVRVPPEEPTYSLRRVRLSKEEEEGYYYGFSNEGIWPLCHIVHTRPLFSPEDWEHYRAVNEKFAKVVVEEIAADPDPFVLIQDYHFALLPRLIKRERPDARIALFWHIPWPNPEVFAICPWQRELLYGMLGADILGFHTQFHCNNFLDTVDHALESRIDWTRFSVQKEGRTTLVKPFPISVAFPLHDAAPAAPPDKAALLKALGVKARFLGIGVERMDYTKGLIERFRAIERFLDENPDWRGEFCFVQLAAPSRESIQRYHDFAAEMAAEADRVNAKFKTGDWRPIVLRVRHHSHAEILPYYRAADFCMVTSLHDGMNLVAKEFVAARDDEGGALILSRFAGAARELRDALIVNPYDLRQFSEAIRTALEMPASEKTLRMRRMRETVRENNIYRWAGALVAELAEVRSPAAASRA